MATSADLIDIKSNPVAALKGHVYTMMAAFAGVIFGVLGSLGFIGNYMQSQFAAQTASINKHLVSVAPASDFNACVAPSGSSSAAVGGKGGGQAAVMPAGQQGGGKGGDEGGGSSKPPFFVSQLINGSISDTGPNSHNTINASNSFDYRVTNNNNVSVSNSNSQSASSGSANVSGNTNGGSSNSGAADNQNSESTMISIDN